MLMCILRLWVCCITVLITFMLKLKWFIKASRTFISRCTTLRFTMKWKLVFFFVPHIEHRVYGGKYRCRGLFSALLLNHATFTGIPFLTHTWNCQNHNAAAAYSVAFILLLYSHFRQQNMKSNVRSKTVSTPCSTHVSFMFHPFLLSD